ncbi:uncharacterized protein LOC134837651 [Culicoides brevitarsis]|uniref:uncharacterized protein LOC134837651 n=1 Tax=Culicoides brevitarsis TaxID=469753 RepID=UPI00307B8419
MSSLKREKAIRHFYNTSAKSMLDENNQNHNNLPTITLEIFTENNHHVKQSSVIEEIPATIIPKIEPETTFPHNEVIVPNLVVERIIDVTTAAPFDLSHASKFIPNPVQTSQKIPFEPKNKQELLEYMIQHDGSVLCKICGAILQSRTHWYRHKYKVHVANASPTPLFQCEYCNVFFKSRKGYIGHVTSRHSDPEMQEGVIVKLENVEKRPENVDETRGQRKIRKDQNGGKHKTYDPTIAKIDEQREREERLVADIINRVRQECAQDRLSNNGDRRGYKNYKRQSSTSLN